MGVAKGQVIMQLSKKIILISLALLVFTRPLICGVTYKWSNTLSQLLILIMAMVWLLEMCLKGEFTFKKSVLNLPIIIFFLFFIISIFRSVNLHESIVLAFQFLSYGLLFFVVANNVDVEGLINQTPTNFPLSRPNLRNINLLFFLMVVSYCLIAGYGYYQYFWGFEATREFVRAHPSAITSSPQFQIRLMDNAVFSLFVFAPALAGYLVVISPVIFSLMVLSDKVWQKVLYLAILFNGIIILFLTYSKGGWGTFGLIIILYLTIFQPEALKRNKKLILACIVVALIAISALYSINPTRVPRIGNLLGSFNTRFQYWQASKEMIKDRPLLGFGPGTFGSIYPRYKSLRAEETQLAHNNYIQVWVESGVFAFLAYMGLVFGLLWLVFSRIRKLREQPLETGLALGVIAFLIHGIVDFNLYVPGIATFFWIFMGIISSSYSHSDYKISFSKWNIRPGGRPLKGITAFVLILVSCVSTYLIMKPLRAQIYAKAASGYLETPDPERMKDAIPLLENAIKYDHTFSEYHFDLARTYETILDTKARKGEVVQDEEVRKIVQTYEMAIRYNYYMPFYHYRLGMLYWKWAGGKDNEKINLAIKEFKTASWLYPTKPFYHQELASTYKILGMYEESEMESEKLKGLR